MAVMGRKEGRGMVWGGMGGGRAEKGEGVQGRVIGKEIGGGEVMGGAWWGIGRGGGVLKRREGGEGWGKVGGESEGRRMGRGIGEGEGRVEEGRGGLGKDREGVRGVERGGVGRVW